jgi:hypothetical protein
VLSPEIEDRDEVEVETRRSEVFSDKVSFVTQMEIRRFHTFVQIPVSVTTIMDLL